MTSARAGTSSHLVAAEAALVGLTLATVVGFGRIFSTWEFLGPMVVVALYAHGITLLARRRGTSIPVTALIAIPGFLLLCSWLFLFSATTVGIPTGATIQAAREAFSASWDAFQNVVAPAPPLPGFVMASCAALFFAVFLADWAAFRLWSALEAIVPASTLFIFCSLLGSTQYQVPAAVLFAAALLTFLLLHRVTRQETSAGWLTADVTRGSRALARTGIVLGAVAVLAAGILVPRIPATDAPAVFSWRGQDSGPNSRVTISPLVDIRQRLLDQKNTELFTVRSAQPSYWRLTSLDTFEGDIWRSGGKYSAVDGDLETALPTAPDVATSTVNQSYTIQNLSVLWLPAAFEPVSVNSPNAGVRYQAESSTLIVDTDVANSNGLTYSVQSKLKTFTPAELGSARTDVLTAEQKDRYTKLPSAFSQKAAGTASRVTAGATTDYAKALALQNFFRDNDHFKYDTDVQPGHSPSAIDTFLDTGRGYCEQFAGAYAAMARSIGLPARVAVGFTEGSKDPTDPELYKVRGEQAHAWPEVFLGQYGWVGFEPTPNRGAPNAQQYTGQQPAQADSSPVASSSSSVPAGASTTVVSVVPAPSTSVDPNLIAGANADPTAAAEADQPTLGVGAKIGLVLLLIVALAGLYVGLVLWFVAHRRQRRRALATDDRAKVKVAWQESVEALALLGTRYDPAETHEEFAQRAQPAIPETGDAIIDLAHDVDAAAYAPDLEATVIADRSQQAAGTVVTAVRAKTSATRRTRQLLDPRRFLTHRGNDRHRAGSAR